MHVESRNTDLQSNVNNWQQMYAFVVYLMTLKGTLTM
jgi:hypothetical protein